MASSRAHKETPQPLSFGPLANLDGDAIHTALQTNTRLLDTAMQLNTEFASFFSHRLSEDLTLPARLAASQSADEIAAVYTDFLSNASREYLAEFEKITSMMTKASSHTVG